MPAAWCRARSWWSISTIRISTATPTPSRCSSAAFARRSGSTSSRPSGGSAISWRRRAMRANSLALRLFLSATAWTVVILFATGVVLSSFYRHAVERAFDRRLGVYLKTLVADVASPEESAEKFPQSLGEPLFELPLSGWYWQVTRLDPHKPEVRSSRSLWDSALPRLEGGKIPTDAGGSRVGYVQGPENQRLRMFERTIDLGEEGRYLIAVAGDAAEIDDEMRTFNEALALTFCVLAIVLLLTTMFQVRFGLAPLKRISESLAAIRSGGAERLEGTFPVEIAPLAARFSSIGSVTEIAPVVTALARTMEKIHHDRGIAIDVEAPADIRFRGERQDLEEMVGNLVDNACKWARSRVSVEVLRDGAGGASGQPLVRLVIDDDGPGLSPPEREEAQEAHRGRRLDETKPGSGLGLSIVVELAHLYGGELSLGTAPIGGLRAELTLPAA